MGNQEGSQVTLAVRRGTNVLTNDNDLRDRARKVIPNGMYGHMLANERTMPPSFPQFWAKGEGAYAWDVDGNKYVDFLCSFGPMLLGHRDPVVEAAAAKQGAEGDTLSGPSARMVELAELLTTTIDHADWAMFGKNGTDATSTAVRIARAATGKKMLLKAAVAYHGANEWFTPNPRGTTPEDRLNIAEFEYNDEDSLREAVAAHSGNIAAIIVNPFRHDAHVAQELVEPSFALEVRRLATAEGAALILDEVRTGFRLDVRGAWQGIGVKPDLTAFSKALANGYPIAAVVGIDALRSAAAEIYVTGSFWFSAVPMAAGIATVRRAVEIDAPAVMSNSGTLFKAGLEAQSVAAGLPAVLSGPVQMPILHFAEDPHKRKAFAFTDAAVRRGVLLHPWHNMFLSSAHSDDVINDALVRTADAFDEIAALRF
jgi:glutamate-1-semialdehyde 2,1-aminomutase